MAGQMAGARLGAFAVHTTNGRSATLDELADRAMAKLLHVSDTADPMVKAQAMVFQDKVRQLFLFYMNEAVASHMANVKTQLCKSGQAELARFIESI